MTKVNTNIFVVRIVKDNIFLGAFSTLKKAKDCISNHLKEEYNDDEDFDYERYNEDMLDNNLPSIMKLLLDKQTIILSYNDNCNCNRHCNCPKKKDKDGIEIESEDEDEEIKPEKKEVDSKKKEKKEVDSKKKEVIV